MKEWYLEFPLRSSDGECIAYQEKVDGLDDDAIHVIEYAAYEEAVMLQERYRGLLALERKELEKMRTLINDLNKPGVRE
jgi:hypothetical protein